MWKHLFSPFPNLLGSNSINNGIQHRWDDHIEVGQEDMDTAWDASPTKPVGKDGEEGRDVEEEDDTDMGATRAQGLGPGISRRKAEDSSEDVNVGNSDKDDVQACGE